MLQLISQSKCFEGMQYVYSHVAIETACTMQFALFLPSRAQNEKVPVLYWLSGLTCTPENFIVKSGAQRIAEALGLALVVPDTSPRGLNIPGENQHYDFGLGAGFYVDAIQLPWSKSYRMYSYVTKELKTLINIHFPVDSTRMGIFGHSMGGHGALTIALKNPDDYKSVSAFSPICSTMQSPWGEKALAGYLGADKRKWQEYDTVSLIKTRGWKGPALLVDQGTVDPYLKEQLKPELLKEACDKANVALTLRMQKGYDHSFFFISTFMEDHLRFHAKNLTNAPKNQ